AMGMPSGSESRPRVTPNAPLDGRTSGKHDGGTPRSVHRSSDHARARMSYSNVRLALDGSVACTAPAVRFHSTQESTVPNARLASAATPPSVSNHSSLVPEK